MLSASAVDALWRACLFKLSKLLALDIRLDDASSLSSSPEEDVTTIESPPSDDDDDDEIEDENDALTVYICYLSILRSLNLCEHSCVHPQKHRLIDRLMSCVYFRAAKVRLKGEEDECLLFDTETMEERLRHRNETKENGNMVVPTRFWMERRGFLRKEVASVMEKVNADVTAKRTREMDFDAPDDDGRQSDEKNGLDEEEELSIESTKTEETNSKEEEDEEMREVVVAEGVGVVAEELNEEEVKEKRESSLAKYADEKHRLAVVNVQRHARGCLARKKMRR